MVRGKNDGLIPGAEIGFVYDFSRKRLRDREEGRVKSVNLKKKIDKLSRKNRILRHK